ncbi:MAG TPA: two-component sensor histidine kinase [Blastocatellia bacterium]|jgi:signal transduction histidine kinase|nr:two-component sensor histidine kinase [Blastocatellia bacterium]HAF25478.1 two-component sensor histidine kinase [Blastocatellia bacterium]HCX31201.1 two-component sensor histidine kinase [Blastocatellia bacterium]
MAVSGRRKSIAFFITLGACLVALAIALNVGWVLLNWREVAMLVFGIIFFLLIIVGVVLNTTFLIREIRRNEQHDAFINAVTHELKTPLASIRLYLETLKTRDIGEAQRREFYDVMLADSDRLLQTVEQVLRAGRSGHRGRRINPTIVDVGEMVRECVDLTRVRYNLSPESVSLAVLVNGDRPRVAADADELRAAVSNLLDNAIKYSGGDIHVAVEVATLDDKKVTVRVKDRGIGIPSAQLKRIFKRFYRVPGRVMARFKGTGLGLFIVRSVVEKHGGRVFAESEGPGHGSTFTIQLPRA